LQDQEYAIRAQIEKEARSAIIQHAFLRWENAALLAMAMILTAFYPRPFAFWPLWGWGAVAAVGIIAIVVSSLTDQEDAANVVNMLFEERFNPGQIKDKTLRDKVDQALSYHQRINHILSRQRKGMLRDRLQQTVAGVDDWIAHIFALALRVQAYRRDDIIRNDRRRVPEEIRALQERLARETNQAVAGEMRITLQSLREQWQTLERLDDLMERADLQLEHSLAALGTVYSQMLLIGNRQVESSRAEQVGHEIEEEIKALQDIGDTIQEMYAHRSAGRHES